MAAMPCVCDYCLYRKLSAYIFYLLVVQSYHCIHSKTDLIKHFRYLTVWVSWQHINYNLITAVCTVTKTNSVFFFSVVIIIRMIWQHVYKVQFQYVLNKIINSVIGLSKVVWASHGVAVSGPIGQSKISQVNTMYYSTYYYCCYYYRLKKVLSLYVCMYVWLNGWMDGCMDEWMDGWMDGWMEVWMNGWMGGWIDGWMYVCMYGWMDGWMDVWMNGWMDGWMDGWKDGWMDGWI